MLKKKESRYSCDLTTCTYQSLVTNDVQVVKSQPYVDSFRNTLFKIEINSR